MKNLLGTLCVAVAGCFAATAALADVTLYASGSAESIQSIVTGFQQKNPSIKVNVVRAGTGSLMQRIKAESANPQADIFMDGGLGTLATFKDNFEPYKSPEA
jgi:iron(III) transport system substrate-binding protein